VKEKIRVLIIEDLPTDGELAEREVRLVIPGSVFERVETLEEMLASLETFKPDIILSDFKLPNFDGLTALKIAQKNAPDVPFIVLTGSMNEDTAVECMKAGAWDYVIKEHIKRLGPAVLNGLEQRLLRKERKRAEAERDSLQEQLNHAQKMEAIGRLAGGVAHDFNNMLSIIMGYGEILLSKLPPGDPLRESVVEIVEAGKRSGALTRQLLAFSRKQKLQPDVLDLNAVLKNLEKMLRRLIGEDVELEIVLSKDLARVMADPGQIEQVIMNLSVNARDAMPRGGRLVIETANVELDEAYVQEHLGAKQGKHVMLVVTDTGCGMDRETLSKIFEPFFTTKDKGKGTGLGLATVYGIVSQSGGYVTVQSEPGQGSTFRIYLPQTCAVTEAKRMGVSEEEGKGKGEHILIVEDEASLRRLCERVLSYKGYRVSTAANGGEALKLIKDKGIRPDLLVTDVVMPGMSGSLLAERLRELQPDIKVLYMSGYTDEALAPHGILEPGILIIKKPFDINSLAKKVMETLRA